MKKYKKNIIKDYIKNNMKKIILLIILLIIIIMVQSNQVNSQTIPNITIKANNNILKKEEQVELTINLNDVNIAAYTIYLYYDMTKLEYISSPENSNHIHNFVVHTWVESTGMEKQNIQISSFVFKALSQEGITSIIVTGEFYNKNGEKIEIEDEMLELQIGEKRKQVQENEQNEAELYETQTNENVTKDNTNLKILRLDKEGITPNFSSDIKEYYFVANTNINSLEVTAVPENINANVTITGNTNLKDGLNTIKIKVESEDKTKNSNYIISVTKTSNIQKANTNLENLAVRNGTLSPEFNNNITKYMVELENYIDKIDILAIPESMNATVEIKKDDILKIGDNQIEVIITAEDNMTQKKYEITAHRRTAEEQIKYEEEKQKQEKILANILEERQIEENREENNDTTREQNNRKNVKIYIIILAIILAIISIIIWRIKLRNKVL